MVTLRLIGPDAEYELELEDTEKPPAVIVCNSKVWVQAQSYENARPIYFEQRGWDMVAYDELKKVR